MFEVTTKVQIQPQDIAYLLTTFVELGYSPWCGKFTTNSLAFKGNWWYADGAYLDSADFSAQITFDDPNTSDDGDFSASRNINRADLQRGLEVMAEKYRSHFNDLVSDSADANTADIFMQCVVFGEEIYA